MKLELKKITKTFEMGPHTVTLETGAIARQASGSVMVRMGGTVVLVAVVAKKEASPGRDFLPLTVNYQEKSYAIGKIPGGYFKREGRPTEKEILTSRLIDRPIRPLFPKGFYNEIQVVATVLSADPAVQTDIPAMIGASAALVLSGAPFAGPIAGARVGYKDGEFMLNPSLTDLEESRLNLVVAGTDSSILMVESEADELPEALMLDAVLFGHQQMQVAIQAIKDLADETGVSHWTWEAPQPESALEESVSGAVKSELETAYSSTPDKAERGLLISALRQKAIAALCDKAQENSVSEEVVTDVFHKLEKKIVRERILDNQPRIDGRDLVTVRPIDIEVGVLPCVHGSAVFTRGETQAIVVATLGTERDAQWIDDLDGDRRDHFMLHYNFPAYCVGEVGMMFGPKRREIGHGRLAKRALLSMLPSMDDFPYVLRAVSEITESNGSSSMASVCGASLALMDAGVPLRAPVAGIAMGLIKEGDRFSVLTDILGDEDHLGDMDFKVAGSKKGITALQMDIKIDGITKVIMEQALSQALDGRLHILDMMAEVLERPREDVSENAPRILMIKIHPDKIRDVIGKGGATIRDITEKTGTTVDISDDGMVKVAAVDREAGRRAQEMIENIVADVEVGVVYTGFVVKIMDFGAFVEVLPGKQGLVHISQIAHERVNDVRDYLEEKQEVKVKVVEIDRQGRIRLSMKELLESVSDQ